MGCGWMVARASLVLVVCVLPCVAAADRVVVAPPRVAGGNAALRAGLRASLEGGLAAAGHEAIASYTVDRALERNPAISSCDTEVCLRRLAELVEARAAVRSSIELLGSSNYSFRLELYDVAAGRMVARVDDLCSVCTRREANEAVSRAAASLGKQLTAVVAKAPDPPTPPPSPPPVEPARAPAASPPRARLYLGLGVTGVVLGLGAVAGGATLLALDGRTEIATDPAGDPIQRRFEGKIPGAVLVAAGGVLVVGGSLFLWRASIAKKNAR